MVLRRDDNFSFLSTPDWNTHHYLQGVYEMSPIFKPVLLISVVVLAAFAQPADARRAYAYVANYSSNTISVIDTTSDTVVSTIPVASGPLAVAGIPSGTQIYVANFNSNTVSVIAVSDNSLIATIPVGSNPEYIAINPAGTMVYATNRYSDSMSVVDVATNTVIATVPMSSQPVGVVVNPTGTRAYVAHNSVGRIVAVVDTATNTVIANVPMGGGSYYPFGLDINPSGTRLYVTNESSIRVIDTATNAIIATVPVGVAPSGVAVSPDGSRVYVTSYGNDNVAVINALTNTLITNVTVGDQPWGIAVNPDNGYVYAANSNSDSVSVINPATNTVSTTIPVGDFPISFGKFVVQVPESNLAIRTRGPSSVAVKNVARVNVVVDNYGPDAASNGVVAINTNGPASAFKITAAANWVCALDTENAATANFLCAANSNLAVGDRPEFVLSFTAPVSMSAATLNVSVGISSDSSDTKLDNNSGNQSIYITATRYIQPVRTPASVSTRQAPASGSKY